MLESAVKLEKYSYSLLERILHECSCFIEFIKLVVKKRLNLFFTTSLIYSIIQEHEC